VADFRKVRGVFRLVVPSLRPGRRGLFYLRLDNHAPTTPTAAKEEQSHLRQRGVEKFQKCAEIDDAGMLLP